MVDVEELTDAEIRTKLMEFGFPVMPITGTTRKVMLKKLKLLMDNKKKTANADRRSLSRYSSEEESDSEIRSRRNKRLTVGVPSEAAQKVVRSKGRGQHDLEPPPPSNDVQEKAKEMVATKRTTTTTRVVKVQDEYETGSDSEPEIVDEYQQSTNSHSNNNAYKRSSPIRSPLGSFNFKEEKAAAPAPASTFAVPSTSYTSFSAFNKPASPARASTYSPAPFAAATAASSMADSSLDRLNQIRSRLSLGSPLYERPNAYSNLSSPAISDEDTDRAETPFLSNFTRRLSQLSSTPKPDYDYKNDVIKEHDANGRGFVGRTTRFRDYGRDYRTQETTSRGHLVSLVVVGVALLFFLAIGVMYVGMRSENSALDTAGYVIPYCIASNPRAQKGVNCVVEGDVEDAVRLMTIVKPELNRRAVACACADNSEHAYMTEEEVVGYGHKHMTKKDVDDIEQALNVLELLTFANPDWGIALIRPTSAADLRDDRIHSMEEAIELRASHSLALAILHPDIPWRCIVYGKLHAVLNTIVALTLGFALVYATHYAYKYYVERVRKRSADVYAMVERIVDTLQTHADEKEDADGGFLVVNHVRDMLLPLSDRKRMEGVWESAVQFIRDNESRVRTEIQVVQGEPYEVWRWLGANLSASSSPRSKTWQGQAFETDIGSVNSLPCSPTPCLKIRGMVDENDRNYPAIKEAVLSKVADKCRILHCAVDHTTNCVYLKCADQGNAAIAYRNLHGWWYARHLVTVKYLRLERYMQRFADSPTTGPPFLKANTPATDWTT